MQHLSAELRSVLAELGVNWHKDIRAGSGKVKDIYQPFLEGVSNDGIEVTRDVPYGSHARHVMDIYQPKDAKPGAPVMAFVHGGAFIRGDKSGEGGMYDNIMYWFAKQGFVGVNFEYRLAPEATFPGPVDDLAKGMNWVADHIAEYGGDPEKVLLIGHSAGGTHVASYVFDPNLGYMGKHVRALVIVSGRLTADVLPENPNTAGVKAYFGEDESKYATLAPMAYAEHSPIPTFVVIAEYENPLLDIYGLEFAHRLANHRRRAPRFLSMRRHNHMSIIAHFNTEEELLGHEILDFWKESL